MNNQLFLQINGWADKNSFLDHLMIFCASYLIYFVFLTVAVYSLYWFYKRQWNYLMYFYASLMVSFIVLQLAGLLHPDHRPFMDHVTNQLVAHASGKSFPSDHTTVTAAIAFGLLFFTQFKKLGSVIFVIACLIGFARIFVGIHYPLDIVGGLAVGLIGTSLAFGTKIILEKRHAVTTPLTHE